MKAVKKILIFAFVLSISLAILSPLILIGNNPSDFNIANGSDFLQQLFLYFLCVFFVVSSFFLVIRKVFFKAEPLVFAIVLVLLVWSFYFPLSIGKLDGVDVVSISYFYLLLGLAFGLLGYFFERQYFIFFLVLLAGPIYEAAVSITTNVSFASKSVSEVLPASSKKKNIFVISFDALEARYVSNLIDKNSDFKVIFDGFINFKNVSGVAPFTRLSVLLTKLGLLPNVDSTEALLKHSDQFITSTFYNNGYDVETYSFFNQGEPALTNTIPQFSMKALTGNSDYSSALEASLNRVFPFPSQLALFSSYLNFFQDDSIESLVSKDPHPLSHYKTDIIQYDSFINSLNVANVGPTFRMHHYVFTHDPITFDEFCEYKISTTVPQRESVPKETTCAIKKMGAFISKLKELDIYDSSLIIFTSDHGYDGHYNLTFDVGKYRVSTRWALSRYMPMLLVKDFDSKSAYVEDNRHVSLLDIAKTLCMASFDNALCAAYEGANLLNNSQDDSPRDRTILISKGSEDVRNYSYFNRVDIPRDTSLATFFGKPADFKKFVGSNLPGVVGYIDKQSRRAVNDNVKGFLTYGPYLDLSKGSYAARITYQYKVNERKEHVLSTWDVTFSSGKSLLYRDNFVDTENKVLTSEYIFSLDRYISDFEIRSYFGGEGELEIISVEIEKLGASKELDNEPVSEVLFNQVSQPILSKGLGQVEVWGAWSVGREVELRGYFSVASSLKLNVRGFVNNTAQHAAVLLNNIKIGEIIINANERSPRTFVFDIPPDLIKFGEISVLKFLIDNPVSPKSVGINDDTRLLGLGFESIVFQ